MKKSKKIIILIIALTILIAIIAVFSIIILKNKQNPKQENSENEDELKLYDTNVSTYVKETENGIKVNTNIELNQDKKIGEITVTGIQLTCQSGITTLLATATNNSTSNTSLQNIEVVFYNAEKKEIGKVKGIIEPLNVGQSTKLNISMSANYINAYNFEFRTK